MTIVCLKEKELSNLRAIIRQSASELLRLEKIIAENNSQNVSINVNLVERPVM